MGPKKKAAQSKPDWTLCPKSGLLYHPKDSEEHQIWLESGDPGAPDHPHILDNKLTAPIEYVDRSQLSVSKLPEAVLLGSVFVSSGVVKLCGLGLGSLVVVTLDENEHHVLTVFPISGGTELENRVLFLEQSWVGKMCRGKKCKVEKFTESVNLCKVLVVSVSEDRLLREQDNKLKQAIHFLLKDKVVFVKHEICMNFYGCDVRVKVETINHKEEDILNITRDLGKMAIENQSPSPTKKCFSHLQTSTPLKLVCDSKEKSSQKYYQVTASTVIKVFEHKLESETEKVIEIGGLDKELKQIMESMSLILKPEVQSQRRKIFNGMLLWGPPGTGKTSLARCLPHKLFVNLVTISGPEIYSKFYGETEAQLRAKFEEAERAAPAILFIDELDSLAPRREGGANGSDQERRVGSCLLTLLDNLGQSGGRVVVLAATNKIDKVEPALRRPGRFDFEVELGVPTVEGRRDILEKILEEIPHSLWEEQLNLLARDTHGFVGADIQALLSLAEMSAKKFGRIIESKDLVEARQLVKPSAMREVLVEVPNVTWRDIGGLDDLKLKLKQAIEWPIKNPEVFARMGVSPPKGLLMYGPPGCSKTMIAKALANESGLNFLSIKGPELFSKWVGESERAVREVFRRARSVAPAIVFFDEIDAVGGARGGGSGKVGDRVLAQLLTEMDGVEALTDVTVVAATNRPDTMDRALLRPGRLDRVVYVPLPDRVTRRKVLEVHTRAVPLGGGVDLEMVADVTEGYSGAEIAAVCGEAAMGALEESVEAVVVEERHFAKALQAVKPRIRKDLLDIYKDFQEDNSGKAV